MRKKETMIILVNPSVRCNTLSKLLLGLLRSSLKIMNLSSLLFSTTVGT